MSRLRAFLKENVKSIGEVEVEISKRFLKENGEMETFKIVAISAKRDSDLRANCYDRVPNGQPKFNTEKYLANFCVACIVEPNLNDAGLQDDYGVKNAVDLLQTMLTSGEYIKLANRIQKINGIETEKDKVEEAKN